MHARRRVFALPLELVAIVVLGVGIGRPCTAQPVPPPLADLAIVELSVTPAMGGVRTVRLLEFREVNLGPGVSPPTVTCLTVSRIDAAALTVSHPVAIPALPAGDAYSDTWAFTLDAPGDYQVAAVADCEAVVPETDERNNVAAARLGATPPPLELLTTELPPGVVGQPYSTRLTAIGDAPPLTYSGVAPPGLVIEPDGAIVGIPTVAGTFPVQVRVVDAMGGAIAAELALLIVDDVPLTVISTELPPAVLGQPYCAPEAALQAIGGQPPYAWSAASPLPDGLRLTPDGVLCGVPTTIGRVTFEVEVTDQRTTARAQVSLDIQPTPLVLDTTPLSGRAGELSSARLTARGGVPPYTFKAEGLPPGLVLDADGTLVGVPTTAGRATLVVDVADAAGASTSGTVELTIAARVVTTTPDLELADPAGCACDTTAPTELGPSGVLLALALFSAYRRRSR